MKIELEIEKLIEEKRKEARVEPRCDHFGKAGGCLLQDIPYEKQLELKKEILYKIFGFEIEILPSPKIYEYRNKMDFVVTTHGIGFREKGKWWGIVEADYCILFSEKSKEIIERLKQFMKDFNLTAWDIRKNEGFLRYIVIREGKFTDDLMLNLVTSEGNLPEEVRNYFDFVTSLYWSINRTKSDVSFGEPVKFWGEEFIKEKIEDITYFIHPNSFFQPNSYTLPLLLKNVSNFIEGEKILDLYCGVGTFAIYLAKKGFNVEGIEINPFSVELAKKNALYNNVEVEFKVGADKDVENLKNYDTIIVDPPRAGLHPRLIKKFIKEEPNNIVYVSCNPVSFHNNFESLKEKYKIEEIIAIDTLPHTPHIELISKLKLKKI